jgi:hypothetical protein
VCIDRSSTAPAHGCAHCFRPLIVAEEQYCSCALTCTFTLEEKGTYDHRFQVCMIPREQGQHAWQLSCAPFRIAAAG